MVKANVSQYASSSGDNLHGRYLCLYSSVFVLFSRWAPEVFETNKSFDKSNRASRRFLVSAKLGLGKWGPLEGAEGNETAFFDGRSESRNLPRVVQRLDADLHQKFHNMGSAKQGVEGAPNGRSKRSLHRKPSPCASL
jgi:hypothetical protein